MPTIKLRAPEGFSGMSIEGRAVDVGRDGAYHADHRDVATLRTHGFVDWHDHPGAGGDIETMTRPQLVEAILASTREEANKRSDDELRAGLRQVREMREPKPAAPADPMTEERISAMTRKELFAYLQENGATIGPATKDDGLRTAALDVFRKHHAPAA